MLCYSNKRKLEFDSSGGEEMNKNKLKGKIRENQKTYKDCAEALNISTTGFSNKLNEKDGSRFTVTQAEQLGEFLGMSGEEKAEIFLS
jgi:hypothetical protein